MSKVDLRQLALLVALYDAQSLGEAARRLHLTPSAASQSLQRLRDALGDEIVIRHAGAYVLTPFGEGALETFREMLHAWSQASSGSAVFDAASSDAHWTLACALGFTEIDLDACYAAIVSAAPRLRLDVASPPEPAAAGWAALRSARVDVLLTTAIPPADADDLHAERFADAPITHCCLSVAHPRVGATLSIERFAAEPHVSLGSLSATPGALDAIDLALMDAGYQPRQRSTVPSLPSLAAILATTDRLATVTAHQGSVLVRRVDGLRLVPLPQALSPPPEPRFMVWHHRTHAVDGYRWLRARLRSFVFTGAAPPAAAGADHADATPRW